MSISSNSSKGKTITHKNGSQKLNIEYEGDIVFTDNDKSIKSISSDGYLYIRKTQFGNRREIIAEPSSNGTVEFEYRIGRRTQAWDKEAQEFLADVLLEVIRTTGIGAKGRIERFYAKGGLDRVLEEVDDIRSDYVSQIYLTILLDNQDLSNEELITIARYVPSELNSDHYITEVFKDHSEKFFATDAKKTQKT